MIELIGCGCLLLALLLGAVVLPWAHRAMMRERHFSDLVDRGVLERG